MKLPYSESTELVMDVLRHGPNVRVLAPPELVEQVRGQLERTLAAYASPAESATE
jgi:predicted DNA-binding transcriptional regulator YafY